MDDLEHTKRMKEIEYITIPHKADIPRLTCFDCKFAAACEDSGYVFCTKRNLKIVVNAVPCFSYYKPRYTN